MKMNSIRLILAMATLAKLIISIFVALYYWKVSDLTSITELPFYVLGLCVAYILLQMLTRRISAASHWWDWVYYLGLISVMLPVTFANEANLALFNWVTDLGVALLILPVLVDGYLLISTTKEV